MLPSRAPVYTSLILQMIIYYNMLFSPVYFILMLYNLVDKVNFYGDQETVVISAATVIFGVAMPPVELARLWLGYRGNLREQVSELSVCFLLTAVPQLPGAITLAVLGTKPVQTAVSIPSAAHGVDARVEQNCKA